MILFFKASSLLTKRVTTSTLYFIFSRSLDCSHSHTDSQSCSLRHYRRRHAVKGYYQYQGFMGSVELLQDLIHDGVGQIGDHWQLHLPAKTRAPPSVCFPCRPGDPRPAESSGPLCLTPALCWCPPPLAPSGHCGWWRVGWTLARRWRRRVGWAARRPRRTWGKAHGTETPWSPPPPDRQDTTCCVYVF